jgi:endonuclease/exonuclease/phosphatase family metal-dependent hydrolase
LSGIIVLAILGGMKLISLNAWGGKVHDPLMKFIQHHAREMDVFCFQEVYQCEERQTLERGASDLYGELEETLSDFDGFHSPSQTLTDEFGTMTYGLGMFVRKGIPVLDRGTYEIFRLDEYPELGLPEGMRLWNRLLQYVTVKLGDKEVSLFNFHGMWTGGGKDDAPVRLQQSSRIREFFSEHTRAKIICGDFNLNPQTQSIKLLEEGMRNLIKESGITSTRSHFYKRFDEKDKHYADYILVSPEISVNEFKVIQEPISDHLPLYLDFV